VRLSRRPRRSIRLRLAALLTALFVVLGGALLGVSYVLVRSNLVHDRRHDETATRQADQHERQPPAERRLVLAERRAAQEQLADDALRKLTVQYAAIFGALAVLSAALGWFASGRVLRPVSQITATARKVSNESLNERIALEGPDDELKQLADTFDSMLARLEAGFYRQAAFVRNASHELRTPLSVIRTETDVTLADQPDDPEALRRALVVVREASKRSERLIDALLTLARADRGDRPRTVVDLAELVRQLIDETELGGLRLDLALGDARVIGDRELLRTMAANLIENAVRHNRPDGWVEIRTEASRSQARLDIANSGPVIAPAEAATLAEPFRRLRTARTGDGLGLGLSIAASISQAHEGEVTIAALDQGGLRVSVRLPAAIGSAARAPSFDTGSISRGAMRLDS
jgi:signal transduction histidine kinase